VAKKHDLPIYMDGARLFNASVALGRPASVLTQYVDMVSFCLSKGLGAPFGAMLCGKKEQIRRAISFRQMLGGGMRQAGIMAAAGIVALETGIDRLAEDHANAKKLAIGLANQYPGLCDVGKVETNMIFIDIGKFGICGQELAEKLGREGILVFPGISRIRLVTHRMISSEDIDYVLAAFSRILAKRSQERLEYI
jgi:threonine aldolase